MNVDDAASHIYQALSTFSATKRLVEEDFAASSAADIVAQVLRKDLPRNGRLSNGFEYMIHGVGYTVVYPNGAQVHIDSNGDTDCFSIYDLKFYLSGIDGLPEFGLEYLNAVCDSYAGTGAIKRISQVAFEINPVWTPS